MGKTESSLHNRKVLAVSQCPNPSPSLPSGELIWLAAAAVGPSSAILTLFHNGYCSTTNMKQRKYFVGRIILLWHEKCFRLVTSFCGCGRLAFHSVLMKLGVAMNLKVQAED